MKHIHDQGPAGHMMERVLGHAHQVPLEGRGRVRREEPAKDRATAGQWLDPVVGDELHRTACYALDNAFRHLDTGGGTRAVIDIRRLRRPARLSPLSLTA